MTNLRKAIHFLQQHLRQNEDDRESMVALDILIKSLAEKHERNEDPTITDGHSTWSKQCAMCGEMTMQVVRVGKVQCSKCG